MSVSKELEVRIAYLVERLRDIGYTDEQIAATFDRAEIATRPADPDEVKP